jgi:hypothetical protein
MSMNPRQALRYEPPMAINREIAARWKVQYCAGNRWDFCNGPDSSEQIYDKLVALGGSPQKDDIDRIIGNDSWTN